MPIAETAKGPGYPVVPPFYPYRACARVADARVPAAGPRLEKKFPVTPPLGGIF